MMELKNKIIVLKYTMGGGAFSGRREKAGDSMNSMTRQWYSPNQQQKKNEN